MSMTRTLLVAALACLLGTTPARADDPKIPFERYTLANGLEVILVRDDKVPLVAVDVWYHVGSGDETPGKSGFAHLFEHMMFQGTKATGEDKHFEILQKIGSSDVNGTTNSNRTNYYEVVPSNQLEAALWLESERMGYLLPGVNEASLANQRDVVRNERRQRYDNVPYGKDRFAVAEALYAEDHPYRYLTIGRHEDLEKASAQDVRNFFQEWYVPANATLAIAGDFEVEAAKKAVDKWFGSFPKSTRPGHRRIHQPPLARTVRRTISDDFARLRRVHYAWHTPALYAPDDAELDVLANALGDTGTGRLYKVLVHDKQLAQNVSVSQQSAQLSSVFHVVVDLKSDADLAEVEKIIDQELERVMREPISQRELERAVVGFESAFVWGLEDLMARAELLEGYNHFTGNPDYIKTDLDRYRTTNVDAIQAVAARWLGKRHRAEIITMPAEKGGK